MCVVYTEADLAKHNLPRAGVHYQLQRLSIHIQHNLTVGDALDGQPKPQRPIGNLPERLQHSTQAPPLSLAQFWANFSTKKTSVNTIVYCKLVSVACMYSLCKRSYCYETVVEYKWAASVYILLRLRKSMQICNATQNSTCTLGTTPHAQLCYLHATLERVKPNGHNCVLKPGVARMVCFMSPVKQCTPVVLSLLWTLKEREGNSPALV